jgi:hypothetical protein
MVEQSVRAQGAVAGGAQHVETLRLPPQAPPTNHGHTTAAWSTTVIVLVGSTVGALGLILGLMWMFWAGIAVALAGVVVGVVLRQLGHGQGGKHTVAKQRARRGH